jgi:hypothetical protein
MRLAFFYTEPSDGFSAVSRELRDQTALVTLPALRQRVHTYSRLDAPPTSMRIFCRFGSKRRFDATIE